MTLKIIAIARHRNGVAGAPFDVVLFNDRGPQGSRKLAILFDEPHHCAVLDIAKLAAGDMAFGSNSWRGDDYEASLRRAIEQHARGNNPTAAEARQPTVTMPAIAVVSVRGGVVQEIRANHPLHVLVEDWDGPDVRPSRDAISPERMLPAEEAELTHFFQPTSD